MYKPSVIPCTNWLKQMAEIRLNHFKVTMTWHNERRLWTRSSAGENTTYMNQHTETAPDKVSIGLLHLLGCLLLQHCYDLPLKDCIFHARHWKRTVFLCTVSVVQHEEEEEKKKASVNMLFPLREPEQQPRHLVVKCNCRRIGIVCSCEMQHFPQFFQNWTHTEIKTDSSRIEQSKEMFRGNV